jgi:hypothetical protein
MCMHNVQLDLRNWLHLNDNCMKTPWLEISNKNIINTTHNCKLSHLMQVIQTPCIIKLANCNQWQVILPAHYQLLNSW